MGGDKPSSKENGQNGMDRREFLKTTAAVAGAAMLGPSIAACGDGVTDAIQPVRGDGSHPLDYINHIVILEMENRSFDHYFASLVLDEGRTDVLAMGSDAHNLSLSGHKISIAPMSHEYIMDPDPDHEWEGSHLQFNDGKNDGFVVQWEERLQMAVDAGKLPPSEYDRRLDWVMSYYKREQLPVMYGLADNFTICDHWFSALLGPTLPNRFYSLGASSDGEKANEGSGISFRGKTPYSDIKAKGYDVRMFAWDYLGVNALVSDFGRARVMPAELDEFYTLCEQGKLPNVSFLEPGYGFNDDHPPHDVRLGQSLISSVYEAVRNSPQWEHTLMLIFYDEHGGIYDSVAPPKSKGDAFADQGFDQLGFRVPGILIGPLVKPGYVMKTVVEHSSVPSLLSRTFGVDHVNERSRLAGTFEDAFDLERVDPRKRQDPPKMPEVLIPEDKIRLAVQAPYGQPDLLKGLKQLYNYDLPSELEQMRIVERHLKRTDAMRISRVVR